MKVIFEKTINQSEINHHYLNLTGTDRKTYGKSFPDHLTRFAIIDGKGRVTIAQKHGSNQIWGTLYYWYRANDIKAGDKIIVSYDSQEFNNGLHVLRLVNVKDLRNKDIDEADSDASTGGGFGDPEENKKIETKAIAYVTKWYSERDWAVDSVERIKCGFDLVCTRKNEIENVEVKGISGTDQSFMITTNEVRQAEQNDKFMLCVVTKAGSNSPNLTRYTGKEFIKKFNITPVILRAVIKEA